MTPSFTPFALAQSTARHKLVLLNDTRADVHHGCEIAVSAIQRLAQGEDMDFIATAPPRHDYANDNTFMAQFQNADGIVVNGEGSIHHNSPSAKLLLNVAGMARDMGKPSMLFNATWAHNSDEYAELAKQFDVISLRESTSAAQLHHHGITPNIAPDAALHFDWPQPKIRTGICVTDSVRTDATRHLLHLAKQRDFTLLDIRFRAATLKNRVLDLRRMIDRSAPFNLGNLADGLAAFGHGFGIRDTGTAKFVDRIANSELIITGRFHAVILALATRTPFLAVSSNTHKIEATLTDAGLKPWRMIDASDLTDERIEQAARWHDAESTNLETFITSGRTAQHRAFQQFRALLP